MGLLTLAFVAMVAAALLDANEWTLLALGVLAVLYVSVLAAVFLTDFVVVSILRTKRAADEAQRSTKVV